MRFEKGSRLTADKLNRLADAARRQGLQGAGYMQRNNGSGVVVRNPRRDRRPKSSPTAAPIPPQWGCSIVAGEEGVPMLRVRSGALAWGGGHLAVWPGGDAVSRDVYEDIPLGLPPGGVRYVVWHTESPPVPLAACPKNPSAVGPCGECEACGTIGEPGDPAAFAPDPGEVSIVETLERQEGWTDMRVLAVVERGEDGALRAIQVQTAEIAVHAIVYDGEDGAPPGAPPCGHPGNAPGAGGGGGNDEPDHPGSLPGAGGEIDHPGNYPGSDGVTPECGTETLP